MKISKIFIKNFQQFQDVEIDFTYPKNHPTKAGKPLDKICFIGKNGTGKTMILELINYFLNNDRLKLRFSISDLSLDIKLHLKIYFEIDKNQYIGILLGNSNLGNHHAILKASHYEKLNQLEGYKNLLPFIQENMMQEQEYKDVLSKIKNTLHVYIPSESSENSLLTTEFIPKTDLNNALTYFKEIPNYHEISYQNVAQFWNLVIYQVKHREEIRLNLLEKTENQNKTLQQFRQEFEEQYPDFLHILSEEWKRILDRAGLYFDYANAKNPVQLNDNLEAYIKDKSKHEKIAYYQLSSGIRHFIFKIGYLKALFFNRQILSSVVLIDEPENSLFPNFLYDIIDIYQNTATNSQFFFATHSPIVASQFEPCERIILDFDDEKGVVAHKGKAPEGDDPNDLLVKDFGVSNLLGKKGKEQLTRYITLKSLIKFSDNEQEKEQYLREFSEIGNLYGF